MIHFGAQRYLKVADMTIKDIQELPDCQTKEALLIGYHLASHE